MNKTWARSIYLAMPYGSIGDSESKKIRDEFDANIRAKIRTMLALQNANIRPVGLIDISRGSIQQIGDRHLYVNRDLADVRSADWIVLYLPEDVYTTGAIWETCYAWTLGKPFILVTEDPKKVPFPAEFATHIVASLDEVIDFLPEMMIW